MNHAGQMRGHHGARVHHGVAHRLRVLACRRLDPDRRQAERGIARGLARQRAQHAARVDGEVHAGKDFAAADLHALQRDAVAVRAQLQVVADVHGRRQEADVRREFLAQPVDAPQQLAVLAAVHQRDQAIAHLEAERVDRAPRRPTTLPEAPAAWPRAPPLAPAPALLRAAPSSTPGRPAQLRSAGRRSAACPGSGRGSRGSPAAM